MRLHHVQVPARRRGRGPQALGRRARPDRGRRAGHLCFHSFDGHGNRVEVLAPLP